MNHWIVSRLAALLIRLLRVTMRIRCAGREELDALRGGGGRYIHAFWHGHLLLMPYAYPGGRMAILISEHRDGEYIARTMERFGHTSVRGSTTSGGSAALRRAVRMAREGFDLGFTPDGPRGPRHRAQMGVVMAARLSGLPVIPVAFAASPAKVMGSWDGFVVPYPFSRGVFVYGAPLQVPGGADEREMEEARVRVESALETCSSRADELVKDAGRFRVLAPPPGTVS
jgi:lysophospholipid acyltransferase (LPLAT)-like uncharacterized protein